MNLYLFDEKEIILFNLPNKIIGNFWIKDSDNRNIVNISARDNIWIISGGSNSKVYAEKNYVDECVLKLKHFYLIEKKSKKYILFVDNVLDTSFSSYKAADNTNIKIGSNSSCDVYYKNEYAGDVHVALSYNSGYWVLKKDIKFMTYLNNSLITRESLLIKNGDVLNIFGLKIVFAFDMLFINNPLENLVINNSLTAFTISSNDEIVEEEIVDQPMYNDDEYFFKSPRIRRTIEKLDINIDSPPNKVDEKGMPMIYTLGPMLTMGASSVVNIYDTMGKVGSGEKTWSSAAPSLIVSGAMLCSMLLWPFLMRLYEKKRKKDDENKRQLKYKAYILDKKKELQNEYISQMQILEENLLSNETCYDIIVNKRRTLWERKIDQSDFLTVRVGKGQIPFDAKINYHTADFSMDDDNLIKMLDDLVGEYSVLNNVPIGYSFLDNNITAISGLFPKTLYFTYNCLLQLMAYHSYDNLKIVVFTNSINSARWNFIKDSLYSFSDDKSMRFFATDTEEMQNVSIYLDKMFQYRKSFVGNHNGEKMYTLFNSYYLVIVDDIASARKLGIIDDILEEKNNLGFSLVILENRLSKLPSQCTNFISIGDKSSGILKNDGVSNLQIKFIDEIKNEYDMMKCSYILSNVPLYVENSDKMIPNVVTFLELFGVGQVEQLNSLNRWKNNDPTKTLKASVGLNENCDPFILDLHEKAHGPHGLIAGMTGSGKSEFIITYILSMAVNYSPEEVSFVLIDYKGGGLAGAFENKELGIKLPHVVGTITNLDKSEINRALASIDSELRRRQQKFNEVREATGESTIDIYKYQKMYRNGIVDEPMPHLIIVSDEFAELKAQQPDFMNDLISTARIGRSLGVHLILATQKPSGVVDAQIWSNSKFKVCLKVQDKSDSMEMIKRADAAELKNVGRFYLQVGYNEYFALGQSAWTGAKYYPSEEFKKQVDKNIYFIDNVGYVYKSIDNNISKKNIKSSGEELSNVLRYIVNVADTMDLKIRQLWLEKISPNIYLRNLVKKYNYVKEKYNIDPIIGEFDDPNNQRQGVLSLPITKNGNTLIYGMPDSGRDEMLQSLVYSVIDTYTSEEVNLYLVDFGAETLMSFNDAPQVGDVVLSSDEEKLSNLIKLLLSEMNKRKKRFASYNGNYLDYIKLSGKTVPNIIVVINVIEALTENSLDLFDKLFVVIRDGSKYGINFVMTTTNQISVRFKIVQSCKQLLCLQLSNDNEYRDILGKTNGVVPAKYLGRGLVKLDKVCEFQTAFIAPDDKKFDTIKETINLLNKSGMKKAKKVPMMPDIINLDLFRQVYSGIDSFPIGITKDTLNLSLYDFSKNCANLISSNELENTRKFMKNYLKLLEMNDTFNKVVVDAGNFFDEFNYDIKFFNSNFNNFISSLKQVDDDYQKLLVENNMNFRSLKNTKNSLCLVIGFEKFYNKLDNEHKEMFKEILEHNKELLKINFVFVDIPSSFKKYEYESWYKNSFDLDDGIWIGFGIAQQFLIKMIVSSSKLSNIDNDYCVIVRNGMPEIVKMVNEIK